MCCFTWRLCLGPPDSPRLTRSGTASSVGASSSGMVLGSEGRRGDEIQIFRLVRSFFRRILFVKPKPSGGLGETEEATPEDTLNTQDELMILANCCGCEPTLGSSRPLAHVFRPILIECGVSENHRGWVFRWIEHARSESSGHGQAQTLSFGRVFDAGSGSNRTCWFAACHRTRTIVSDRFSPATLSMKIPILARRFMSLA